MFHPHQLRERLAVLAGLSLLGMSIVPTTFARPVSEGSELVEPAGVPAPIVEASGGGFDWSAALVVVLIGLAILVTAVAVHHAANRRGIQLTAR